MKKLDIEEALKDDDVFTQLHSLFNDQINKGVNLGLLNDSKNYLDKIKSQLTDKDFSISKPKPKSKSQELSKESISQLNRLIEKALDINIILDYKYIPYFQSEFVRIHFENGGNEFDKIKESEYLDILNEEKIFYKSIIRKVFQVSLLLTISEILEKYLSFFESFGFIDDGDFIKGFNEYMHYMSHHIFGIFDYFNYNFLSKEISKNTLGTLIRPFKIKKTVNTNEEYFNDFLNSDVFYKTRDFIRLVEIKKTKKRYVRHVQTQVAQKSLSYEMTISIDSKYSSDIFSSLFYIAKSIESIKGVNLKLKNIEKGSVKASFTIELKDIVALCLFRS